MWKSFFSGLGTTRAAAGGFQEQFKIDHDLNLELAKAAVRARLDCIEGKEQEKVRILGQSDIVRLGRTEWKD